MYFSYTDIDPSDTLYVYDGSDINSPLIGAFNNGSDPKLYLQEIEASLYNISGCLTVRFVSDGDLDGTGWAASISCLPLCQSIISHLDLTLTSPQPDTNYIAVCPGLPVTFAGKGEYPDNNYVYQQNDINSTFLWYFGDGDSAVGQTVNHTYAQSGGYMITLLVTDSKGCVNKNSIDTKVIIAGNPIHAISSPDPICANDTISLSFSSQNEINSSIDGSPYHVQINSSLGVTDTTFLPDGTGVTYTTNVTFNCFGPGQTLDNAWDIVSLCANMEHSYLGDLEIKLVCPSGLSMIIKEYPGGEGTFLGEPIDITDDPTAGVGYNYCWSPTPTLGTMVTESANYTTLPSGTYTPYHSFAYLVGCPLNGQWAIEITDNWAADDGFIFSWELQLNPLISPNNWQFTVPISLMNWTSGQFIIDESPASITIKPEQGGLFDYTYTIVDAVGCIWDTSITLPVIESPVVDLGDNLNLCNAAGNVTLDAGNSGFNYHWSNAGTDQTIMADHSGEYSVTVTNGLCKDIDTVLISYNQLEATGVATNASCFGIHDGSVNLTSNTSSPPCSFSWSHGLITKDISNLYIGNYTVTISDANNCTLIQNFEITEPEIIKVITSPNQQICVDANVNLFALAIGGTSPYNYAWSNLETTSTINVSPAEDTQYIVTITDKNNCIGSPLKINVSISDSLNLFLDIPDTSVCLGEEFTIRGKVSGGLAPYIIKLNQDEIVTLPYIFFPDNSQTFTLCVKDQCTTPIVCENIPVEVLALPQINLQSDVSKGCSPLTVNFNVWSNKNTHNYLWNFGNTEVSNYASSKNPVHIFTYPSAHNISLSLEDEDGCKNTHTIDSLIFVYPKPIADFYANPPIASIFNPEINFNNMSELNDSNIWSFGDGNLSDKINPFNIFKKTGKYDVQLIVFSGQGCSDTIIHQVSIDNKFSFYAPSAISPDANEINDIFYIYGANIKAKDFHLIIYDRWGQKMFETKYYNPENPTGHGWNGKTSNNKIVPLGSYIWMASFKDMDGITYEKTGSVTVIR